MIVTNGMVSVAVETLFARQGVALAEATHGEVELARVELRAVLEAVLDEDEDEQPESDERDPAEDPKYWIEP
jgi:hypothetical protein